MNDVPEHLVHLFLLFHVLHTVGHQFDLFAILNLAYEYFCRLKCRDIMLVYDQGCVAGNIPGNLFFPLFVNKATKTTDVNVVAVGHGVFDHAEKGLNRCRHICFVYSCFVGDFVDDVCFGHCIKFRSNFFGLANLYAARRFKNYY
jgi:hypothetical protein